MTPSIAGWCMPTTGTIAPLAPLARRSASAA
jgi:hypothetical protein